MAWLERIDGKYRIGWREGGAGGKVRKSERFATKREALVALRLIEARQEAQGAFTGAKLLSWDDLVQRYCLSRDDRTTERHRTTLTRSATSIGQRLGWTTAGDVRPEQVAKLGTLAMRYVRALLNYAQDLGQPIDPRALAACKPKSPRRKSEDLLTEAQVTELQERADQWHLADGLLLHLISRYGHRAQSLVGMRWADLDAVGGRLTLKIKSGDIHRHPLLPETLKRFGALRDSLKTVHDDDLVLIGHLQRPWEDGQEAAGWMGHSLGVGVLPLRRYAITRLLDVVGGDARTAASITGHRTPSLLLNVYARTSEARQKAALAALMKQGEEPSAR